MKNTHREGHEEHEGKKSTAKERQVLIDKNPKLRVLRDLRGKRNQSDSARLLMRSLKTKT